MNVLDSRANTRVQHYRELFISKFGAILDSSNIIEYSEVENKMKWRSYILKDDTAYTLDILFPAIYTRNEIPDSGFVSLVAAALEAFDKYVELNLADMTMIKLIKII